MNKRLLVVNVYYAPHSFGGATIVAEEMAALLVSEHGWQALVLTAHSDPSLPAYALRRYRAKGVDVVSVNVPRDVGYEQEYGNTALPRLVEKIVDAFRPTLAHVHATQNLGCAYFDVLKARSVPIAVTLHDCWWLCERLFMIAADGRYCFQQKIDPQRCAYCVDDAVGYRQRDRYLRTQLGGADLLLAPSEFQRDLYLANGFDAERSRVNKNGVRQPGPEFKKRRRSDGKVVFGFIGGPGPIKGADLVLDAFRSLSRQDQYALCVVDAAKNAGTTWENSSYWDVPGEFSFLPPYDQETMDDFFAGIDVLLFPSQWKESFGLTVREALLRDVWVIATEAGGVVEDLRHGINATVIPLEGDSESLADAIQACLDRQESWVDYRNPFKRDITTFARQAAELDSLLVALLLA